MVTSESNSVITQCGVCAESWATFITQVFHSAKGVEYTELYKTIHFCIAILLKHSSELNRIFDVTNEIKNQVENRRSITFRGIGINRPRINRIGHVLRFARQCLPGVMSFGQWLGGGPRQRNQLPVSPAKSHRCAARGERHPNLNWYLTGNLRIR